MEGVLMSVYEEGLRLRIPVLHQEWVLLVLRLQ